MSSVGPQFDRLTCLLERLVSRAKQIRLGNPPDKGFIVEPAIFTGVDNHMAISQEEVFGPVRAAIPFDTEEEAITIVKDTRYGLASGVWTTSLSRAMRMTRAINAGTVWINTCRVAQAMAPFANQEMSRDASR